MHANPKYPPLKKEKEKKGVNADASHLLGQTQPAIKCSKLTIETLEQGVKYVQS